MTGFTSVCCVSDCVCGTIRTVSQYDGASLVFVVFSAAWKRSTFARSQERFYWKWEHQCFSVEISVAPLHSQTLFQSGFQSLCCLVTRKTWCFGFLWNYLHWRRRNIRTNWPCVWASIRQDSRRRDLESCHRVSELPIAFPDINYLFNVFTFKDRLYRGAHIWWHHWWKTLITNKNS